MSSSASVPTIGSIGRQVDLLIRQGGTFGPVTVTMTNPDASPVDLTACELRGQIRKRPADADIVVTLEITVTNAAAGQFVIGLTDEATAGIPAGESMASAESRYVYDVEMEDAAHNVMPLLYGMVTVFREVTRGA